MQGFRCPHHESVQEDYSYKVPVIPNLSTEGVEWPTSRLGQFTAGNKTWYPLNTRLGGPHSRPTGFWKKENLLHPTRYYHLPKFLLLYQYTFLTKTEATSSIPLVFSKTFSQQCVNSPQSV